MMKMGTMIRIYMIQINIRVLTINQSSYMAATVKNSELLDSEVHSLFQLMPQEVTNAGMYDTLVQNL